MRTMFKAHAIGKQLQPTITINGITEPWAPEDGVPAPAPQPQGNRRSRRRLQSAMRQQIRAYERKAVADAARPYDGDPRTPEYGVGGAH